MKKKNWTKTKLTKSLKLKAMWTILETHTVYTTETKTSRYVIVWRNRKTLNLETRRRLWPPIGWRVFLGVDHMQYWLPLILENDTIFLLLFKNEYMPVPEGTIRNQYSTNYPMLDTIMIGLMGSSFMTCPTNYQFQVTMELLLYKLYTTHEQKKFKFKCRWSK